MEVRWVFGAILGLLVLATTIVGVLSSGKAGELRARVRSWWIMVAIFALALMFKRNLAIGFFAFLSFLALKEYLSLIPTRRADRRVLFWVYLTIPLQYYWIATGWYHMFLVFIPVWAFLAIAARMVLRGETENFLHAVGTLHWGLMMMVFALSHLAYLLVLPENSTMAAHGAAIVEFSGSTNR